jgi:DNA-binding GntR family transcriptional regulator
LTIRIPRPAFDPADDAIALPVRIEIAVVRQVLKPGETVPLVALAERFRCGAEALAEALAPLHAGGLLRIEGSAVRIPDLAVADIDGLLDERRALETRIVARVMERLSEADRKQLLHLIRYAHMAAVVGDLEIMVKHDTAIDDLLAHLCDDHALVLRSRTVKSLVRRIWAHTQTYLDLVPMMELRRKAIEAIAAGDAAAAEAMTLEVIEAVRLLLSPSARAPA